MQKIEFARSEEVRLGSATYIVAREFVGSISREELLLNKLVESRKERYHHEKEGSLGEVKNDNSESMSSFEPASPISFFERKRPVSISVTLKNATDKLILGE